MIVKPDNYFLRKAIEFGCLILEEIKARLLSYRVIGKDLIIVRKLNNVVYCIRKSNRHKNKVVHLDCLALFYERQV